MRFNLLTMFVAPVILAGVVVGMAVSPNNGGPDGFEKRCSEPGGYCTYGECCPGSRCEADYPNVGVCIWVVGGARRVQDSIAMAEDKIIECFSQISSCQLVQPSLLQNYLPDWHC
ncbi:hypothetical protein EDC04DRAFT_2603082 [Pisolithus marmoratus]|nr:hypothetical protein EDC04DRAFT_2603082 [Pisolithus marmoratus]